MITQTLSITITLYLATKIKIKTKCPAAYALYAALTTLIATTNTLLTKYGLSALIPPTEEFLKITGSKLFNAENPYILSGLVFGIIEMLAYTITIPTTQTLLDRLAILYIHPSSMYIYYITRKNSNPIAGFFAASTYHSLWNYLAATYTYRMNEIAPLYAAATLLIITLGRWFE